MERIFAKLVEIQTKLRARAKEKSEEYPELVQGLDELAEIARTVQSETSAYIAKSNSQLNEYEEKLAYLSNQEGDTDYKRLYEEALIVAEEQSEAFKEETEEWKVENKALSIRITQLEKEKQEADELVYRQSEFILRKKREAEELWD